MARGELRGTYGPLCMTVPEAYRTLARAVLESALYECDTFFIMRNTFQKSLYEELSGLHLKITDVDLKKLKYKRLLLSRRKYFEKKYGKSAIYCILRDNGWRESDIEMELNDF